MKRPKARTFGAITLAVISGSLLMQTSQNVQQAERKLSHLRSSVEEEREKIRVLKAEWAYLNSPDRLEALAAGCGLAPSASGQIAPDAGFVPGGNDKASSRSASYEASQGQASQPASPDFGTLLRSLNGESR